MRGTTRGIHSGGKRCRLDGGEEEDGTQRLPDVDVVPAPEPAHVLRERTQAGDEGRAMRHPYRGMPLTGPPLLDSRVISWRASSVPTQTWTKMAMLQKLLRSIRRLVAALDGWTLPEFMSVTQMGRFKEFAKRTAPWPPRRNYKLKRGATVPTSQPIRASATSSIIPTNASRHVSRRLNTRSLPPRRPRSHELLAASVSGG